jgi:hypothetical protein
MMNFSLMFIVKYGLLMLLLLLLNILLFFVWYECLMMLLFLVIWLFCDWSIIILLYPEPNASSGIIFGSIFVNVMDWLFFYSFSIYYDVF